ncbi:mediator of RNA polymerase II transcription subunit 25-like isoform X3 [Hibiscus syriacus]|uniref:mediator of RNA polymerase II transcription subunit 25-like isoform X3 n=1 Tax=Hibiscus syriacus TaxID=106335 RepID=UPI001923DC68|nr:mediator of RNA polymerase II transcription subunit 25-like isoform X3 [Hibiscus syriacus]
MAERQLIVAVEGTAAMSPYWQSILSDYLEKIIRSFCSNESAGQKNSPSNVELSLITLNAHGSYWAFLVQRSGWTKDVDIFLQWLSALTFSGGGFNDAAIAEGLSEALMMFPIVANGNQSHQIVDGKRHCILVAASNPYPLPTPVYRPQTQNLEQRENAESQIESRLSDAETVAKSFPQCSVSLSVICPKQLSKLKAIYMAGKRNPSAPDPPFGNVRNSQFLVLISENFMEGRAALSLPGVPSLAPNQSSSASSKYIKVWEGNLCGPRHGMPVFITRLEVRYQTSDDNFASNIPHFHFCSSSYFHLCFFINGLHLFINHTSDIGAILFSNSNLVCKALALNICFWVIIVHQLL